MRITIQGTLKGDVRMRLESTDVGEVPTDAFTILRKAIKALSQELNTVSPESAITQDKKEAPCD